MSRMPAVAVPPVPPGFPSGTPTFSVATLAARVVEHLWRLGAIWK